MGPLLISAMLALAFAWMWQRNHRAAKFLNRLSSQGDQQVLFDEWKTAASKWLSSLNWASFLLTMLPLSLFLHPTSSSSGLQRGAVAPPQVVLIFNVLFWGSVANFVRWLLHRGRASRLSVALNLPKGIGWLVKGRIPESTATPSEAQPTDPTRQQATDSPSPSQEMGSVPVLPMNPHGQNQPSGAHLRKKWLVPIIASICFLMAAALTNSSSHALMPDVAGHGPNQGHVVGYRYVHTSWWGLRKKTYTQIRFAICELPAFYDPEANKWVPIPSEAYADAEQGYRTLFEQSED